MGGKAVLSGVRPKGKNGIEFDFSFQGKRHRPTIARVPSEANLRRAHKQPLADSCRPDGTLGAIQAFAALEGSDFVSGTGDGSYKATGFITVTTADISAGALGAHDRLNYVNSVGDLAVSPDDILNLQDALPAAFARNGTFTCCAPRTSHQRDSPHPNGEDSFLGRACFDSNLPRFSKRSADPDSSAR
jgi:hypothetical protein